MHTQIRQRTEDKMPFLRCNEFPFCRSKYFLMPPKQITADTQNTSAANSGHLLITILLLQVLEQHIQVNKRKVI